MVPVKFKALHPDFKLPEQKSEGAAGFDLCYYGEQAIRLGASELSIGPHRVVVPLGFAMEIPPGYEAQIRPRSGLAHKHGVTIVNAPGTIDCDYRGEVKAILAIVGNSQYSDHFYIEPGDRVCQMVIQKLPVVKLELVDELSVTERAEAGLGSTGVK